MDRDKANIMRLRVNRINLVQRIDPSEVLPKLVKFKVIDKSEAESVNSGRSKEDRSRNLIDRLITKEHLQKDWYNHFRNILQDCSYKDLVVFLDNTIIKQPSFVSRFANQDVASEIIRKLNDKNSGDIQDDNLNFESISSSNPMSNFKFSNGKINNNNNNNGNKNSFEKVIGISFNEERLNSIKIKGNYERTISNLQTFSIRPEVAIAELGKSHDSDDKQQIDLENALFISMRKLELLYSLYQSEESLKNTFFLDTEVVSTIINSDYKFIYMKYFKNLQDSFGIDILKYFKDSFIEYLKTGASNLKFYENLNDLVKKLCWLLIKNEESGLAQELIQSYLHHISLVDENIDSVENHSIWKNTFETQSLLLLVKNSLMDYKNAYDVFTVLSKLLNHIKHLFLGTTSHRISFKL
jgi:hypothetical protein